VLDDTPNTVASTSAGATYVASVWVRAPAGRNATLRVREMSGSTVVRSAVSTVVGDGSWRQISVTTSAANGGTSLSVEIVVSLTKGVKAQIDDVSLQHS
jgi:hypothetical protein